MQTSKIAPAAYCSAFRSFRAMVCKCSAAGGRLGLVQVIKCSCTPRVPGTYHMENYTTTLTPPQQRQQKHSGTVACFCCCVFLRLVARCKKNGRCALQRGVVRPHEKISVPYYIIYEHRYSVHARPATAAVAAAACGLSNTKPQAARGHAVLSCVIGGRSAFGASGVVAAAQGVVLPAHAPQTAATTSWR